MSPTPVDPEKLRLIAEVARHGSLSKVALAEGSSQPYISKVIGQFEAEWGARLFRRTGRGMVLTDFGRAVLPRVEAWLRDSQSLVDDFKALAGTATGEVRLAMLPSISSPLMAALFVRVRERFPGIRLRFMEAYVEQIDSWLQNGQADLGVTLRYEGEHPQQGVTLVDFDIYLCAPPGDPVTCAPTVPFEALDALPMVVHNKPGVLQRHLEKLFAARGMALNVVLEVNSLAIQRDVAAVGGGYVLLSHNAISQDLHAGRLSASRVVGPSITQYIDLMVSRNGPVSSASREVARELQALVGEAILKGTLRPRL